VTMSGPVGLDAFQGLEQFRTRGKLGDIGYCIAGAKPYALEFTNDSDVICLLLGDIVTETKFEDDREKPLIFLGQSAAFHPQGGNVRVRASAVRDGFIAFSYARPFIETFDDVDIAPARRGGSRNNIRRDAITSLSRYVRQRFHSTQHLGPSELQSWAIHLYLETIRSLELPHGQHRFGLSDQEFAAICDFVEAELSNDISCAQLAATAGVPLRVLFDGMKQRVGISPYRFIIDKRIERAQELLRSSRLPIAEIALACGFSSQQHLTATLSTKIGLTPQRIRQAG
jgi:AraC family transcriptional regulator